MIEKNYLTPEEQNIWRYIKGKGTVDNELIKCVFPEMPQNKRNRLLHNLYKKGYLRKARKDLYYTRELNDFHELALRMHEGYIGLSSALRYHNLIEYEDFTIFVMTENFRKNIDLKGTQYNIRFIPLKHLFRGFEKKDGIYISSVEKTLFDCFLKPRFIGLGNLTKAVYDSKIEWGAFIGFFKQADNNALYQRTGYILELMKKTIKFDVPESVLDFLLKKAKTPVKLAPVKGKSLFDRKWKVEDNIGGKNILSWWH